VKADAAHYAFAAFGKDIVWAVVDSGIEGEHVHFNEHHNLDVPPPLKHRDFTALDDASSSKSAPAGVDPFTLSAIGWHSDNERPLEDPYGHGTHVAGIIAGENTAKLGPILAVVAEQDQESKRVYRRLSDREVPAISGLAPKCKLLSLKVLDAEGSGDASSIIAAIGYIQELNDFGRRLVVHGVNISATYPFFPEWFACGQSPVCVEVNRLVKTGVVVVVSAGNTGYANEAVYRFREEAAGPPIPAGQPLSINDPGNAEEAITVGSTHRESPHKFGISYFSSKGPTGDGRAKPDLVAPGEKVISCAAGDSREKRVAGVADNKGCDYCEDTGTSMAAPHVSGAIAAFLSIRPEFIGRAEEVKRIFLATATDLGRNRDFQGRGLIDLMRAIQSI
jgi:subtilisin family serine protease